MPKIHQRTGCEPKTELLVAIVIPVFNEVSTVREIVTRAHSLECAKEILLVDDGSTDGTTEIVDSLRSLPGVRTFFHEVNMGKGAAVRTGIQNAKGSIIVIQDADLEYDPTDIPRLIQPIRDGRADVVFGSRFRGEAQRVHLFWHRIANAVLTLLSNMTSNLNLSDMECGYKAFRREVFDRLRIRENSFGVEPELTVKVAKHQYRVYEVPVSYAGRDYTQGKKIRLKDALRAIWCILRYWVAD